ncbi:hypothetical protein DYB35_004699 [Aphanomyces astaci]|uniref:Uncharacterized protein n=1 Tax=Aphanomyces astaci TaxID=112090 RepID=A0A3R7BFJ9_APHAT|nr:hypothetical protein DYB35_004699 [Aphanomyces astaci]
METHPATSRLVTSFAAKECVHEHISVEWTYDTKLAQCMTLLRAHLPGDIAPSATLSKLSVSDLVLSIEAAELQHPLVVVLCHLHPSDATACIQNMFQYHQSCAPPYDPARATTLEALVYTSSLFIAAYTPAAKGALKHQLESLASSSSCLMLQRAIATLSSDAIIQPASPTAVPQSSAPPHHPHVVERLLTAMQHVTATDAHSVADIATACVACCDHRQCLPSAYVVYPTHEALLQSIACAPDNSSTPPLPPSTHDIAMLHVHDGGVEDDWHAEPILEHDQALQTFSRLLTASRWSHADMQWLRQYLETIDDVHVLRMHVGWVIHQHRHLVSISATAASLACNSSAIQSLMNFVTCTTSSHAFLRCAAFDPIAVIETLLQHGLHTRENQTVCLDVLYMLAPFVPRGQLIDAVATTFLTAFATSATEWRSATEWARRLIDPQQHDDGVLITLAEFCAACICIDAVLASYDHIQVVQSTLQALVKLAKSFQLADDNPPTWSHLVDVCDDVRLYLMLANDVDFPWLKCALATKQVEWAAHIEPIIWGAILDHPACVAALPVLHRCSIVGLPRHEQSASQLWALTATTFAMHVVAPHTNPVQFHRLVAVVLPQLVPELPRGSTTTTLVLPSSLENEQKQQHDELVFEWTMALWAVRSASVASLLVCIGAVLVVVNDDAFIHDTMREQVAVLCRQLIVAVLSTDEANVSKFAAKYLDFCIDQVTEKEQRWALHRFVSAQQQQKARS